MLIFCKKMLTSAKLRLPWYEKVYFLKPHKCVYLHAKFQVSSIIVTSFRLGGYFPFKGCFKTARAMDEHLPNVTRVPYPPKNSKLVKQAKLFNLENVRLSNSSNHISKYPMEMNPNKAPQNTTLNKEELRKRKSINKPFVQKSLQ